MSSSLRRVIAAFLLVFLMNGALAQDAAPAEAAAPDESAPPVAAEPAAPVKHIVAGDRLNVRGSTSLRSEVIVQLRKDETVLVAEKISVANPKKGEPAEWSRIHLPEGTPVWVSALYIDEATKTVKPAKLNIRSGPGENFSAIGLVKKDDEIKELRRIGLWIEIATPKDAFGYVASQFLTVAPDVVPVATEAPLVVAAADPVPQAKPEETPVSETPVAEAPVTPVAAQDPVVSPDVAPDAAPPEDEKLLKKRIVQREGRVVSTLSIQAPTPYSLKNVESGDVVNYLLNTSDSFKVEHFKGFKVIVRGEEVIDRRWTNTPILKVDYIMFAP